MQHCWAFAIALDDDNKSAVTYLYYRLHFVLGHKLFNVHMIACPMYELQTGQNSSKILSTLCPKWAEKLIGITTDGASKMTGCHAVLATHIERVANAGVFRVCCAAHQLDLVVQARFKSMYNEQFVHVIQGITGYLRRQDTSMKSTCPRFIEVYALAEVVSLINITFRELQVNQLLLDEQKTS
jgi:hypothetical protein